MVYMMIKAKSQIKKLRNIKYPRHPTINYLKSVCEEIPQITCLVHSGVREKGSSKKVGLMEAHADKDTKGFNWNNPMLQRWIDP